MQLQLTDAFAAGISDVLRRGLVAAEPREATLIGATERGGRGYVAELFVAGECRGRGSDAASPLLAIAAALEDHGVAA